MASPGLVLYAAHMSLPNPLNLPGYRCAACDVGLVKTWSIYAGDVWMATEKQTAGALRDRISRLYCPQAPSAAGGWGAHIPKQIEAPAGAGHERPAGGPATG